MQTSLLNVSIPFSGQQDSAGVQKAKRSRPSAALSLWVPVSHVGAAEGCDLLIWRSSLSIHGQVRKKLRSEVLFFSGECSVAL
jgi:hypothetical protein